MKRINTIIESSTPPHGKHTLWLKSKEDGSKELVYNGDKVGTSENNTGANENNVVELDLSQVEIKNAYNPFSINIVDKEAIGTEDGMLCIVSEELCSKIREFIRNPNKEFLSVRLSFCLTIFDEDVTFIFSKYHGNMSYPEENYYQYYTSEHIYSSNDGSIKNVYLKLQIMGNLNGAIGNNTIGATIVGRGKTTSFE